MHPLSFICFLSLTVMQFYGLLGPSWGPVVPITFAFVLVPILDAILGVYPRNPTVAEQARWNKPWVWGFWTYTYTISHFALLATGFAVVEAASWPMIALYALAVGVYTGGLGITVAHELAHKRGLFPRFTANALLCTVWYQHFYVEHVRGHHMNVATPDDPASARRGESSFRFLARTYVHSYLHALKIESKRIGKTWSPRNQILQGFAAQVALTVLVAGFLGPKAFAFFLAQSFIAFTLLELVNYVEHYGLSRRPLENGRYEKVTHLHSWNSSHWFSNALLFNLQRHSDHHAAAHLPFTSLRHFDDSPQLPSGYPGMLMLSAIPPLWFLVMDPKVDEWRKKHAKESDKLAS